MTAVTVVTAPALLIRDLPGIDRLEDKLLLYGKQREGIEDDLTAPVALRLFGVSAAQIADAYEEHDNLFTAWENTDDETLLLMLTLGIDFTDARGQPLRCTVHLAPAAEIAARGIAGKVPNPAQIELDRMASKMEQERDAYMKRRRI